MTYTLPELAEHILAELRKLPIGKSLSPQEIAQRLPIEDWHPFLSKIKQAGFNLGSQGAIVYLRKGKQIDPSTAKGVIRWRLPTD